MGSNPAIPTKSDTKKYQNPVNQLIYRVFCFSPIPNYTYISQAVLNQSDYHFLVFKFVVFKSDLIICNSDNYLV